MSENLSQDLVALLGEENFVRLVEAYGGQGWYIAGEFERSEMRHVLGEEIMKVLAHYYGGTTLKVPIGRVVLAKHYRRQGLSNREIAGRLRVTESTVYRLLKRSGVRRWRKPLRCADLREARHKAKKTEDPRQMNMFG